METGDSNPPHTYSWKDFLFAPFGCLISIPPYILFGSMVLIFVAGLAVFYNVNIEILGIGRPPYTQMQVDKTWEHVTIDRQSWSLEYESYRPNTFQGLVRFIGPIRQAGIPFLTHDMLVTSGDFANTDLVNTAVFNHTFSWYSSELEHPEGAINLIHAVPQKQEIYQQLLEIKTGQQVRVTGFEVLRIDAYNEKGNRQLWWQDSGCNTLLITQIEIFPIK